MQEQAVLVLSSAVRSSPEEACRAILSAESFAREVNRWVYFFSTSAWRHWVLLCLEIGWMISSIICNAELVLLGRMRYIWRRGEIMLVLFRAS